jgi:putative acetyltransferase
MAIVERPGPSEEHAIAALVTAAFGQPDEALLVDRLRAAGHLIVELVARDGDALVGHIAFSVVEIGTAHGDGRWWALAPLSVAPDRQRQGTGTALVRAGLAAAWRAGATLILVLGEPDYYARFGFLPADRLGLRCPYPVPPECFMALRRGTPPPAGTVTYAPEFPAP